MKKKCRKIKIKIKLKKIKKIKFFFIKYNFMNNINYKKINQIQCYDFFDFEL